MDATILRKLQTLQIRGFERGVMISINPHKTFIQVNATKKNEVVFGRPFDFQDEYNTNSENWTELNRIINN